MDNTLGGKDNMKREDYPMVLSARQVAEIMGVSRPTAYMYMNLTGFPRINLPGTILRVGRDQFFQWLDKLHNAV